MCELSTNAVERRRDSDHSQWTVNDILRHFGPAYLNKFRDRMSSDQIQTLHTLSYCRMPAAGSVLYRCRQCSTLHSFPRSCGNRHCPTCQGEKAKVWLDQQ